jgi:hypothetical protein
MEGLPGFTANHDRASAGDNKASVYLSYKAGFLVGMGKRQSHMTMLLVTKKPRTPGAGMPAFSKLSYQQTVSPHVGLGTQGRDDSPSLGKLRLLPASTGLDGVQRNSLLLLYAELVIQTELCASEHACSITESVHCPLQQFHSPTGSC